jgi:hypothetical protein
MIPLLVCARFSVKQIIIGSPLTFGVGKKKKKKKKKKIINKKKN